MAATLTELGNALRARFVAAGIDPEEIERELQMIFEHVTGWTVAKQHLEGATLLSEEFAQRIEEIAEQRCRRVPLQYCLGEAWFMGLRFHVRPGVLIPRADTEVLVETVLKLLDNIEQPTAIDVGTGSGAIAIALAKLRPDLRAFAVDNSEEALQIARQNAKLNGVSDRVDFILSDWLEYEPNATFHAVVANPPYIPFRDAPTLQPEVKDHEPGSALFGIDPDGLGFYRHLSRNGGNHLVSGGFIAMEVGKGQADAVRAMLAAEQWLNVKVHNDLNKIGRVVSAFRP